MKSKGYEAFIGDEASYYVGRSKEFGKRYQELYDWRTKRMYYNYGQNVEYEKLAYQIVLCPETESMIYDVPEAVKYRKGLRPELDKIVEGIVCDCKTDREKLIELTKFCRDLYKRFDNVQLFYGGTEEILIQKGERLCEALGRLIVSLAEVAGIPARIVMHVVGGHITAELYIEETWVYVDPRCGMIYEKADGKLASVRDCMNDPSIFGIQPDWVKQLVSPLWTYDFRNIERNSKSCLNPGELQTYCDYSLTDADRYHFDWVSTQGFDKWLEPYKRWEVALMNEVLEVVL